MKKEEEENDDRTREMVKESSRLPSNSRFDLENSKEMVNRSIIEEGNFENDQPVYHNLADVVVAAQGGKPLYLQTQMLMNDKPLKQNSDRGSRYNQVSKKLLKEKLNHDESLLRMISTVQFDEILKYVQEQQRENIAFNSNR